MKKQFNIYLLFILLFSIGTSFALEGCSSTPATNGGDGDLTPDIPVVDKEFKVYNAAGDLLGTLNDLVPIWVGENQSGSYDAPPIINKVNPAKSYVGLAIADKDTPNWTYVLTSLPFNPTELNSDEQNKYGSIWTGLSPGRTIAGGTLSDHNWVVLTKAVTKAPGYNLILGMTQSGTVTNCLVNNRADILDFGKRDDYEDIIGGVDAGKYGSLAQKNLQAWYYSPASAADDHKVPAQLLDKDGNDIYPNGAYELTGFDDPSNTGDLNTEGRYDGCLTLAKKFLTVHKNNGQVISTEERLATRKQLIFPIKIVKEENQQTTDIATIDLDTKYDDASNGFDHLKQALQSAGFQFVDGTLSEL